MRKIQKNKKLAIQGFKERVEAALYACPHDLKNRITRHRPVAPADSGMFLQNAFVRPQMWENVSPKRRGRHQALPLLPDIFESLNA